MLGKYGVPYSAPAVALHAPVVGPPKENVSVVNVCEKPTNSISTESLQSKYGFAVVAVILH